MKYYLDTEFFEDGPDNPIRLISIGLVSEDGREYYAEVEEIDLTGVSDWLKKNVVPHLSGPRKPRATIAKEILDFVGWGACAACGAQGFTEQVDGRRFSCVHCNGKGQCLGPDRPEFWGYFADYDWVLFCQLYGRMIDLPHGMPMLCHDVKQMANQLGVSKAHFPRQAPETLHNALYDARWTRKLHEYLQNWVQAARPWENG